MPGIRFCFEYRNAQTVYLPVNPPKLEIETPGQNATLNIVNLGDTSILKKPGLKKLSLESFIPVQNRGSYVNSDVEVFQPKFYQDFFEAIQRQKEPINFVVTELSVSLQMSVEDFSYWWEGGDADMHFKITLKEYRQSSIKITNTGTTTATPATGSTARQNTTRTPVVGSRVLVNGRLYRDSYGAGPGATEKDATRLISIVKTGRPYPYHVTTLDGGWRGWVSADSVEVIS